MQGLPDLLRRLPDTRALAFHGVQVRRVDVFRAQHAPGHGLQCTAFLAPGAAHGMFRVEPAGLVLRQVRMAFPPRRDAAGQGAHLFRQRRLRRIDLPPFRHRAPYMRIDPLGGLEPFAQLRHPRVVRRMQLRDAGLRGPCAKRVPRSFEAFGIVEKPRALERLDGLFQAGARSRHGMEVVGHHAVYHLAVGRLAVGLHQAPALLQKRHPFLAPGIVFGKLLDGQSLRGGRPAELRPAPPMVAHALDEAAHLAVTREMPLVLRQHGVGEAAHVLREVLDLRQRRSPRHRVPVAREEEGKGVRLLALPQKCPPVRRQRRKLFGVHHRGLGKVDPQRLQRPLLAPVLRLKALDQRLTVIGQQQERLGDPAELDMEKLGVDPAACVQHGDRPPRRPALCRMHGRAIRVIEMAQLRVAERETELPVCVAEAHPLVSDLHDLRFAAIDQVRRLGMVAAGEGCLAVARPANPVAGTQLDPLGVVEAQIARRIARGPEPAFAALRMGQHDPAVVVAHDDADVVRAAAEDVAMEHDGVAGLVAPDVGSQRTGEPPVDQAVDGERAAPQHAFLGQPLAHGVVRLPADRVRGGEDQGVHPMLRRQREPAPPRLDAELLRRRLPHPIAQLRDRRARLRFPGKAHRSPQLRVALALHLLHRRCRHARLLQQTEGLPRIHRLQLFGVAHQHDPRHLQRARDAQQRVGANAADHRGLVHRQNRARVLRPGPRQPRRVGEVAEAGQEVLQRPRGDAGLPGENPGGDGRGRQALYLPLSGTSVPEELLHLAQHGRLAAAGMALHADHEVVRQQHRADRLPLAPGEARRPEPRLDGIGVGQRRALAAPRPHRRQHVAFGLHRPVGDEGPVHPPAFHLDQLAVAHKPCDRRVDLGQRVAPRCMAKRHGTDLGLRNRGAPLRNMRHRPRHRLQNAPLRLERQLRRCLEARACEAHPHPFASVIAGQRRQRRRALLAADHVGRQVRRGHARHSHPLAGQRVEGPGRPEGRSLPDQPQCLGPRAPFRHEVRESPVLLAPARAQRGLLRILRRVGQLLLFQVFQDRPAPAREGIDERAIVARKLEPRYRPHHARHHRHAERLKAPRQLVPVIRPDQLLAAADPGWLHAPPFA